MTNRSPILVLVLSLLTCGIYHIYWFVVTKNELNARGADIPTAWLIIIPFVNIYWLWRFCAGVEKVSGFTAIGSFLLQFFFGSIGAAIIQYQLNTTAGQQPPAQV